MTTAPIDSKKLAYRRIDMHAEPACLPSELAVVIPCFNEAECLPKLAAAMDALRSALAPRCRLELLLVDDGSRDETPELLERYFGEDNDVTILRHVANRGIAAAIATGLRHTRAEIVASLDADLTYDPLQLLPMLRLLADDVALVVASPYHPRGEVQGVPRWRLGLSQSASRIYRFILRNKLHTYTSCVRVYRRSSVIDLPLLNGGFAGVVELVCRLDQQGGKIVEHPAQLTVRTAGQSKMRITRTILAHARLMTWAARRRLFASRRRRAAAGRLPS